MFAGRNASASATAEDKADRDDSWREVESVQ